jgi:hypothetical protein
VPIHTLATAVKGLVRKYLSFGDVADGEYFNTVPGGLPDPGKVGSYHGEGDGRLAVRDAAALGRRMFSGWVIKRDTAGLESRV